MGKSDQESDLFDALVCNRVAASTGDVFYTNMDGKLHRINGPALVTGTGVEAWYLNGLLHREDGPAYIHKSGLREWYRHGVRHRDDGPAIEFSDGSSMWIVNGNMLIHDDSDVLEDGA